MYDIIIKNAKIIDGTGNPYYRSDVAIKDGKIARIGKALEGAEQVIDATGLTLTPGFIDSHSHVDRHILTYPEQREKIEQGITTSIAGQCGESPAPISLLHANDERPIGNYGKRCDVLRTASSFINIAKNVPQGSNTALLIGNGALRGAVIGPADRRATPEEMEKMKALLREGLEAGAIGVSFGLIYAPACFADTEELIELAKVVAEYHGVVAAHIRGEGATLIRAVEEFISVIRASGARGVISHHKSAGIEHQGKINHSLRIINEAWEEGLEVYLDVYPYIASHTSLSAAFIPKKHLTEGTAVLCEKLKDPAVRADVKAFNIDIRGNDDLGWVMPVKCPAYPEYEGKRLNEIAKIHGKDVYDTMMDMIQEGKGVCNACFFSMCEEDVCRVMAHPRSMIGTDAAVMGDSTIYHPRLRGTFPRVLGRYVRERGVTDLPRMIAKMTSLPATVYSLKNKGLVMEGFDADLCIFDADKIIDRSDFTSCHNRAEGLNYVILGGEVVVENAVHNGKCNGKILLADR